MFTPQERAEILRKVQEAYGPQGVQDYIRDAGWDAAEMGMHLPTPDPGAEPTGAYANMADQSPIGMAGPEYRSGVEQALGAPVDWDKGLNAKERLFGAMSETPEEESALVGWSSEGDTARVYQPGNVPGDQGELFHRYPGAEAYTPYNAPGFDVGDLGAVVPEALKGAAAAATTLYPWGRAAGAGGQILREAVKGGLGYGIGQTAEETAETAMGTQRQTIPQQGATVVGGALGEAAFGGLGGLAMRSISPLVRSGPTGNIPPVLRSELEEVRAGMALDPNANMVPGFMVQGGSDYRTAYERLLKNVDTMSGRLSAEKQQVMREIAKEEITPEGDITARGLDLLSEFDIGIQREFLDNIIPQARMLQGGQAVQKGTNSYVNARRREAGQAYKDIENVVADENPVFDFTGPKQAAAAPGRVTAEETVEIPSSIVDAQGNVIMDNVVQFLEVDPSPGGVYNRVSALVQRMDDFQNQYQIANTLQSQLGKHIEGSKDSFGNLPEGMGPAIQLRNALLDTLENPANGQATPRYKAAIKDAREGWRKMAEETQTKEIYRHLKESDPMTLVDDMLGGRGVPPEMTKVLGYMEQLRPQLATTYKQSFQRRLLTSRGATNEAQVLQLKEANPDLYNYIGGDAVLNDAKVIDELWKSPGGQMALNGASPADGFREVIPSIKSPQMARQTLQMAGGRGSTGHQLLQFATVEDITRSAKTLIDEDSGVRVFNSKAMDRKIADLQESGVWDTILTPDQRTRLKGLASRIRIINRQLRSDSGAALEMQKVVSDVKHPNTMLLAMAKIEWNHILAGAVLQKDGLKKLDKVLSTKAPLPTKYAVAFSELIAPVYSSFDDGEIKEAATQLYDNGVDWIKNEGATAVQDFYRRATRGKPADMDLTAP